MQDFLRCIKVLLLIAESFLKGTYNLVSMRKVTSKNYENQKSLEDTCGLLYALEMLKGRWTINVLWSVHLGYKRYGEIKSVNPMMSEKMLTQRLKDLQQNHLLTRTDFGTNPPKVEYNLSPTAKSIIPILDKLCHWGSMHRSVTEMIEEGVEG